MSCIIMLTRICIFMRSILFSVFIVISRYERHFAPNVSLAPNSNKVSKSDGEDEVSDSSLPSTVKAEDQAFTGNNKVYKEWDLPTESDDSSLALSDGEFTVRISSPCCFILYHAQSVQLSSSKVQYVLAPRSHGFYTFLSHHITWLALRPLLFCIYVIYINTQSCFTGLIFLSNYSRTFLDLLQTKF